MPRGRLVFPFLIDLAQLDTSASAADPDGAGPLTSGYDEDFREPEIVPPGSGSARGEVVREESILQVSAQIEPDTMDQLRMMASGNSPDSEMKLALHFRELERKGLLDADGRPTIRVNDRLDAIRNKRTGDIIERIPNPPGLFVIEVQSRSFGLGTHRNLCVLTLEDRETSTTGA